LRLLTQWLRSKFVALLGMLMLALFLSHFSVSVAWALVFWVLIDILQYGAWGEARDGNSIGRASPFGFVGLFGGYWDARLEKNLFWNRWYGPEAGRWASRDPIGIWGNWDIYLYVSNGPAIGVDPDGLYACTYSIRTHTMTCRPNNPAHPIFTSSHYVAGNNTSAACTNCQNNPARTNVRDHGPAPVGTYDVGAQHRNSSRRNLEPRTPNGRTDIQAHGCPNPATCSDGCLAATDNATRDGFNAAMARETNNTVTVVP
jgi:RHS repeat-associated protein